MVSLTMHNPFLESPSQLRKDWKAFRTSLSDDLSDDQHLAMVANWWSKCPFTKQWLDWDDPKSWPNPWELIATGAIDYSAIALGIGYTLLLTTDGRWTTDRLKLWLVSDTKRTFQHLAVAIDDRLLLNVEHANVVEVNDDIIVHSRYCYDNKLHINSE